MNKFNKYFEERRSKIQEFQDKINETLDKEAIADVFEMGLNVGFFGDFKANHKLFLRFQEGAYNYTLIRTPVDVNEIIQRMGLVNPVKQRVSMPPINKFNRRRGK